MNLGDKFFEIISNKPTEIYRQGEHQFRLVTCVWKIDDKTTIEVLTRVHVNVYNDEIQSTSFSKIRISKKRFYNLFTKKTEISESEIFAKEKDRLVDIVKKYYEYAHSQEWVYPNSKNIDDLI